MAYMYRISVRYPHFIKILFSGKGKVYPVKIAKIFILQPFTRKSTVLYGSTLMLCFLYLKISHQKGNAVNNDMKMVEGHTCAWGRCITFWLIGKLSVKPGDLGFPMPDVKNRELCAGCGICIKACPFSDEFEEDE